MSMTVELRLRDLSIGTSLMDFLCKNLVVSIFMILGLKRVEGVSREESEFRHGKKFGKETQYDLK